MNRVSDPSMQVTRVNKLVLTSFQISITEEINLKQKQKRSFTTIFTMNILDGVLRDLINDFF